MPRFAIHAAALVPMMLACATAWPQARETTANGIDAQRIRPGLHVLTGAGCNVVAWSGPDGTVLVDSGTAAAAATLLGAVAVAAPGSPLRFVVNTHWHPDHTGGNEAAVRAGAVPVAHENARARMSEPQDVREYDTRVPPAPRAALPVVMFADSLTLSVNGSRLVLLHLPEAHTDGDAAAWWPEANVVHMGDLYYADGYPFVDNAGGGSLAGVVAALETVLSRTNARTAIVPGHGPVGTRTGLAAYRDMLVGVGRRIRDLIEQGQSLEEVVAARPTAPWDERYGSGGVQPERFVRILYEDLTTGR
jgi:glyoxylase-like metal-dependent hydrolase (beta-lactamase superfamily II)